MLDYLGVLVAGVEAGGTRFVSFDLDFWLLIYSFIDVVEIFNVSFDLRFVFRKCIFFRFITFRLFTL